jgi:NADH:ubiquinone reductase (H+-translocating)
MADMHRVVIVGGGFGGLYAAQALRKASLSVTLLDRRNYHLFFPLLYQVATGGLSPGDIASPLRAVLKRQKNVQVLLVEVVGVDVAGRRVMLAGGTVPYDSLIVAAGATHSYFGHDEWEPVAPGLKTFGDALEIRRRILLAFEDAERATDPAERESLLTFVVVGGGPTGVELAGMLGEIAHRTLRGEFRTIDPASARVLLVEGADRVLPTYPADLSAKATGSLARLGVTVRNHSLVTEITAYGVTVAQEGRVEQIPARTVVWAAGVQASPLGKVLSAAAGAQLDRAGRVLVADDLSIPGHPEIFVIGDLANYSHQTGKPLPGVAPVAMQEGAYVARLIQRRLQGETLPAFHYGDKGSLATIGRAAAVADFGKIRFSGFFAWLVWLFVHLLYIVEFESRVLIFIQWAWDYFTRNRMARLITDYGRDEPPAQPAVTVERRDVSQKAGAARVNGGGAATLRGPRDH